MDHFLIFYIYIFGTTILFQFQMIVLEVLVHVGLFRDCVYCFQSHLSLYIEMVIRYFPVFLYLCATSFSVCMVCISTFISLSGLHSLVEICASGIINCKGMYLVSLFCASEKLAFIMFV